MKYNKRIITCSIFIIISFTILIVISNKNTKTFNYNGNIIALKVDGTEATSFPSKGKYNVNVNCTNGKGVWNPKTWKLEITEITNTVKCDILFNSNASNLNDLVNSNGVSTTSGTRYQGTDPNNYVWYNDELWRIIGNIPVCLTSGCSTTENRVKLIRNNSIGTIKYSNLETWTETNMYNLLNTCYLGKKSSCDSYCYTGYAVAAGTCDYSSDGIDVSDYYGSMVEDVYYNIGALSRDSDKTADKQYSKEIAKHASISSKIGIMYLSDFYYAIKDATYTDYQTDTSNNWLFANFETKTMSVDSDNSPFNIDYTGNIETIKYDSNVGFATRPVLYLKPNVYLVSGTGTQVDPYRIGM